jgi:hypothetical protein
MDADVVAPELIIILQRLLANRRPIKRSAAIYHDLHIAGDDAHELLSDVSKRFDVSFVEMDFDAYFPSETEVMWHYWKVKLGFPDTKRRPLTVDHLLAVVERGVWFDPEPSNKDVLR